MISARRAHAQAAFVLEAHPPSEIVRSDTLTVVADATIDNVADLRSAGLSVDDYQSSAEIIAAAYRKWGTDCARHLLGDFVFIVWDAHTQTLYGARDHLGVRPLYLRECGGVWEIGSVARDVAGPSARPSTLGIALYMLDRHDEDGFTFFEDVRALAPAHQLTVTASGSRSSAFWRPSRSAVHLDDATLVSRFAATFAEAVRCRLRGGPTGVEVSGGLDSSSVACVAAALSDEPPVAMHLAYPGMTYDETHYCDTVTQRHDLPLLRHDGRTTKVGYTSSDHPDLIFDATLNCFEPLVEKAARRGVKTVLTGVGGDQLMDEAVDECAAALRDHEIGEAARIAGITHRPWSPAAYKNFYRRGVRPLLPEPWRRAARRFRRPASLAPLTKTAGQLSLDHTYAVMQREHTTTGTHQLGIARELGVQTLLLPVQQSHRLGVPHGIRFRHPFLDVRLIELMLTSPRKARLRDGVVKRKPLLRRALRAHLPRELLARTDTGEFSDYLRYVLVERHGRETSALFEESRLADLGIIDPAAMRGLLEGTSQIHINRLTSATGMELWLRRTWS